MVEYVYSDVSFELKLKANYSHQNLYLIKTKLLRFDFFKIVPFRVDR